MNSFFQSTYFKSWFKELVRDVLNEMSGDAWSDGSDFEHEHLNKFTGMLRWDFENTGELQYWNGDEFVNIHEPLPNEADGEKLWIEEPEEE